MSGFRDFLKNAKECAHDQNRKKPGSGVQAVSPAAEPAPLLGPAGNQGPEAQPQELCYGAPGDALHAKVRPGKATQIPRAPPSPLALPPLSGPLKGTGGAQRA